GGARRLRARGRAAGGRPPPRPPGGPPSAVLRPPRAGGAVAPGWGRPRPAVTPLRLVVVVRAGRRRYRAARRRRCPGRTPLARGGSAGRRTRSELRAAPTAHGRTVRRR